jgi:para-nitrobenzyl esterase
MRYFCLCNIEFTYLSAMRMLIQSLVIIAGLSCCVKRVELPQLPLLTVRTEGGYVQGNYEDSVYVFKGVPYAAPPIEDLRWRAPEHVIRWRDTLECLNYGASAIQNDPKPFMMWTQEFITPPGPLSEDCLFLNVWSGAKVATDKLPVFVWIHGGAFNSGSAACAIYDGAAMARAGIVFVSINYRLGIFGFMAHPELTSESGNGASGNYGLMDQLVALRWVHDNIAAFGGDPSKVTIGGQSAGAMSVHALVASPLSKRLVHGAIAESGAASRPAMSLKDAELIGVNVANAANVSGIRRLRRVPADSLLRVANTMPFGSFFPIVDGYILPDNIISIMADKQHLDVPLLAGWVTGDGALGGGNRMNAGEFRAYAKTAFGARAGEFLATFPADTDEKAVDSQLRLAAMRFAGLPDHRWALANTSNSFLYEFSYVPTDKPGFPNYGAFHTAEVPFALHTLDHWNRPWKSSDRAVEKYMSAYWLNFIKQGNPNGSSLPVWKRYDAQDGSTMSFGVKPELRSGIYKDVFGLLSAVQGD